LCFQSVVHIYRVASTNVLIDSLRKHKNGYNVFLPMGWMFSKMSVFETAMDSNHGRDGKDTTTRNDQLSRKPFGRLPIRFFVHQMLFRSGVHRPFPLGQITSPQFFESYSRSVLGNQSSGILQNVIMPTF